MKLKSCDSCGVVLDLDKFNWPKYIENKDGSIDETKARYNQYVGKYQAFQPCPVCKEDIFYED